MNQFYNIVVYIVFGGIKFLALFNKKLAEFVKGRAHVFTDLEMANFKNHKVIWIHSASLGEFEQGIPIIEKLKIDYPNYKILVTFFSPSGYTVRKNYPLADCVTYLPFNTQRNVRKFIDMVNIKLAIFIKYEFWPNYLKALRDDAIPTILVSGIFRKDQLFFKWYGRFYRKSLRTFNHFFVQNKVSKTLLNSIGFQNITVCGDTRFDRVFKITQQPKKLDFIEAFAKDKITLVAGSTWKEDTDILINYINTLASADEKFIIAPHNIHQNEIAQLIASCHKSICRYSDSNKGVNSQVLIIDSIGLLTSVYNYANLAYVGGGFNKSGIHNILEPATFGLPIFIGPNYQKFQEAKDLIHQKACISIANSSEFNLAYCKLLTNKSDILAKGTCAQSYILNNIGASDIICNFIDQFLTKK